MSMSKEMVREKMKEKDVIVLNVLSPEAYQKMHIPGSVNLAWAKDPKSFVKNAEKLYGKDKFYITHCSGFSCMAGPSAGAALRAEGFRAADYAGGMEEWFKAGSPVAGTAVPHAATK
jgi:rhodanese-related sulfurtransferase